MGKRLTALFLALAMSLGCASCGGGAPAGTDEKKGSRSTEAGSTENVGAVGGKDGVTLTSDAQAAYYHDFANLIPFYEDVPYVEIKPAMNEFHLSAETSYNWLQLVRKSNGETYPYVRLRQAIDYALSDVYVLNGHTEKDDAMRKYFIANNTYDTWGKYDGLLWYLTFLNYRCAVETEEDQYGTLVHVKISNADIIKLLYEELENTYEMVKENNAKAADRALKGAFESVDRYFEQEAENNELDHVNYYYKPGLHQWVAYPSYGNSFISKLNLAELGVGLAYRGFEYYQNKKFWERLSGEGILYNYVLANMFARMAKGDYSTVHTEVTFYADVDEKGNGYLPFDTRNQFHSFITADWEWDSLVDVLESKGIAAPGCSMKNIQKNDRIYSWGYDSVKNYENMLFWLILGWRGQVVSGKSVTEYPDKIGYTGGVAKVTADSGAAEPTGKEESEAPAGAEGESVTVEQDPSTGLYEVEGVLYWLNLQGAKAVGTVEGFDRTELVLPKEINGRAVTAAEEGALAKCDSLTSITFPEGFQVLGKGAIAFNPNLASVSLPSTLTEIGAHAFASDGSLKEVILPYGVKEIKECAFLSCGSLEELVLPDSVKKIGVSAFKACGKLRIYVPKTAKSASDAFEGVAEVISE